LSPFASWRLCARNFATSRLSIVFQKYDDVNFLLLSFEAFEERIEVR
jgi:hypothetical protein